MRAKSVPLGTSKALAPNFRHLVVDNCRNCEHVRKTSGAEEHLWCGEYKLVSSGNDWIRGLTICDDYQDARG